jgi:hypothetical protein
MISGRYNLTIEQGTTFRQVFTYLIGSTPIDLTGHTARLNISKKSFNSYVPFMDLTTENSRLTLGGDLGTLTATLSASETLVFTDREQYLYDLEIINAGTVSRLLRGKLIIIRNV